MRALLHLRSAVSMSDGFRFGQGWSMGLALHGPTAPNVLGSQSSNSSSYTIYQGAGSRVCLGLGVLRNPTSTPPFSSLASQEPG